jgi:hypothetical protein
MASLWSLDSSGPLSRSVGSLLVTTGTTIRRDWEGASGPGLNCPGIA